MKTSRTRTHASPAASVPLSSAAAFTPLLAALAALALYIATLHPGLPAGDSGELITVVATDGVAHPPGYPLYTLLGRLFITLVRWGSVAWRLNLFSALTQAAAVGVLALAVQRLTRSPAAGLVAAVHPDFRDDAQARTDLTRYLATGPVGADADDARRALEILNRR